MKITREQLENEMRHLQEVLQKKENLIHHLELSLEKVDKFEEALDNDNYRDASLERLLNDYNNSSLELKDYLRKDVYADKQGEIL